MQRKKGIFLIILLSLLSIPISAQIDGNINEWIQMGFSAIEQEKYQDAIFYFDLVKENYEKEKQNDDQYCFTLSVLGTCYYRMGNYPNAIKYGTKAMDSYKSLYGEKHPDYAQSLSDLALYYYSVDNYTKAVEYEKKSMCINREVLGEDHPKYALNLGFLALSYISIGDFSKAIEYGRKTAEVNKNIHGEKHPEYAESLRILANLYTYIGNYSKAVEYESKAKDIYYEIFGENNQKYATSLNNLAQYYAKLGDLSKAIELGVNALEIRKVILGENHPDYASSLTNIANYYYQLGNYTKAIEYGNESVNIYKDTYVENHPKYAISLNNLALFYSAIGDYSMAIELGTKALEITKNNYGEIHPDYAVVLNNLALQYSAIGDYQKALEYGEKAVEIHKVVNGDNNIDYASALTNLANHYHHFGNYSKALEYTTLALKIFESTLGENHPDNANILNHLSLFYYQIGDYNKSIEYGKKGMNLIKKVLGEYNLTFFSSITNLSNSYHKLRDYTKALDYGKKTVEICRIVFGENHLYYATAINNLASLYSDIGDCATAIELHTKVADIRKTSLGKNHPDYALSLNNLADSYSRRGDYTKAIDLGTQALEIYKVALGEYHPNYAMLLENLALYYFDVSDYTNAIKYFQHNLDIKRTNICQQISCLLSSQRSTYWNEISIVFTDFFPFLTYKSQYNTASDLYNLSALFAKGLLLTTEIEINRLIKESGDEDALKMYEDLRIQRLQIQRIYEAPVSERNLDVDSLVKVANQLEQKLVERSNVFGDFTKKMRTTWKDVQETLSIDEIAIEFLSFNVFGTDSTMVTALTLRKDDTEPKFIPLFEMGQLKDVSDKEYFMCPEMTNLIWKSIKNELQGIHRIYFSPSGILHKIPIEYLPGMENFEMYRLSTTRDIIDIKTEIPSNKEKRLMAVLYGGVDYEEAGALPTRQLSETTNDAVNDDISRQLTFSQHRALVDSLDIRGLNANYLPNTLTEVNYISKSLEKAKYLTVVYTGADATETSVMKLSSNAPNILHISTHGFYYSEKQAKKGTRLRFMDFDDERKINMEDKALSRSGLLMAGANLSLKGKEMSMDDDDGILTAQEISKIDLRGTELVVLSACNTGKGDITQGEGVYGLQRGFKKAGVKTILMSLWKVSDISTEMLMTEFYKNLCDGKSKRESLRLAQQIVREYKDSEGNYIFKNPHYWAGFILLD